jgi:hypothetical protein
VNLGKVPNGPDFERWISLLNSDQRVALFNALENTINNLAEATKIDGLGFSERHGGKVIVEVYQEQFQNLRKALIAGNFYGLPNQQGIYQLLAKQW